MTPSITDGCSLICAISDLFKYLPQSNSLITPLDLDESRKSQILTFDPACEAVGSGTVNGSLSLTYTIDDRLLGIEEHEVLCYQTIVKCAELNQQVDQHLANHKLQDALEVKREIIVLYQSVANFDQFAVISGLLDQEQKALEVLKREGISEVSNKTQSSIRSISYCCSGLTQKASWERSNADEDQDMGYMAFDDD